MLEEHSNCLTTAIPLMGTQPPLSCPNNASLVQPALGHIYNLQNGRSASKYRENAVFHGGSTAPHFVMSTAYSWVWYGTGGEGWPVKR